MKTIITFFLCFLLLATSVFSQEAKKSAAELKEERRLAKLFGVALYPLIKSNPMSGVFPVTGITERPDTTLKYKLLFVFTLGSKDTSKVKKVNYALGEIGRIVNLHIASGIPKQNLEVAVAVHGLSIFSIQNDAAYKAMFKINNPNLVLLKELQDAGVKFIACGQAMGYLGVEKEALAPGVKIALTAQTIISSYQLKGYVLFDDNVED